MAKKKLESNHDRENSTNGKSSKYVSFVMTIEVEQT